MLSLCYQTKCWRDNVTLLRGNNFLCYSPSYSQGDGECQSARNMQSSILSSTKVERGVIFGCARCCELYGLGYSRLKHSTNCPFNHDSDNSNEEGIEQEVPVISAYSLALKMSLFAEELMSDSFHYDESSVQNDTEHVRGIDGAAYDSELGTNVVEDSKDGGVKYGSNDCEQGGIGVHEDEHDSKSDDGIIIYGGVAYGSNDFEQDGDSESQDDICGMKYINVVDDEHLLSDSNVEFDSLLLMEAQPQGQQLYHRSVWGIDALVVDDSTERFTAFHCVVVEAVTLVKDSIKLTQPFISFYLSKWSRCHFVGVEALQQVCTALTIPVSVSAYLNFVHCIPMLNDFFTYKERSTNCCVVEFYMSSAAFKAYLVETHCNIDFDVALCGYTRSSLETCIRCIANSRQVLTDEPHDASCDVMMSIFPELDNDVNYSLMQNFVIYDYNQSIMECNLNATMSFHVSDCVSISAEQQREVFVPAGLQIEPEVEDQVVCVMYETANYYAETCHFGLPTKPPPAFQSDASRDNESLYITAPFIDATNGSILMRSLDRVDAVKVSVSLNLCVHHFSSLFKHS